MKLSVKISILVALVSVIPAIIVLGYTLWTIQQNQFNSTLQDVMRRVELSADRLSYELESSQREIHTYVQMSEIQSMQPEQFLPFLSQEVTRHNGRYEKFIIGTPQSTFYNTAGGNPAQNMLRTFNDADPKAEPKNIRSRDYWQYTAGDNLEHAPRSIISNPMISYTTGARQVVIASSIIKDGKVKGTLGAAIDWDRILTLINEIQAQQFLGYDWDPQIFLATKDGTYWYHWNPQLIATLATTADRQPIRDKNGQVITKTHSLVDERFISAEDVSAMSMESTDFHRYKDSHNNEHIYLFHTPIGSNGYTLGLTVRERDLLPPLISYASIVIIFLASLALVLIAANIWHRRNIISPLSALMNYIHQVSHGKYDQLPPRLNNEEFNQVATTLNDMSCAITERQQALRESEIRFECAMAGTNDGLWDWDLETQEIYYSPRWCEMLGYKEEELAPNISSFNNLVIPEDKETCEAYINQFLNTENMHYHLRFRMRHKNGNTVYILSRASLIRDEDSGQPIRMIGTHVDITDDKLHEEKINKLNEELEARVKLRTQELEEANRKLEETSLRDGLTQVGNRRAMEVDLANAFTSYQRHNRQFALMLIDIDYFKPYNDHYGHPKGDEVLRNVAKILMGSVRTIDTVYRYGGEEFLILMPDTDQAMATNIAQRTRANICLEVEPHVQSPTGYITISAGVTTNQKADRNWQAAIKRADKHLYEAKKAGRNNVVSDPEPSQPIQFIDEKSDKDNLH